MSHVLEASKAVLHLLNGVVEVQGVGECCGVHACTQSKVQGKEQLAQLSHHRVLSHYALDLVQCTSDTRDHEHALQRAVGVAGVSEVVQPAWHPRVLLAWSTLMVI